MLGRGSVGCGLPKLVRDDGQPLLRTPRSERTRRGISNVRNERKLRSFGKPSPQGRVVRVIDARQRSVERDNRIGLECLDELDEPLGLRFRARPVAGTEGDVTWGIKRRSVHDRVGLPITGREVPVELDATGVATGAATQAIRIGCEHNRTVRRRFAQGTKRAGQSARGLTFLTVDRSEYQQLTATRWAPDFKRRSQVGAPIYVGRRSERAAVLSRAKGQAVIRFVLMTKRS